MSAEVEQPASRRRRVRPWRRTRTGEGPRRHRLELKLSDAEWVRVKAAAEVQQCSMQAVFTRALAADGAVAALKYQLLRDDLGSARRLLVQVSHNLNQTVRLAHIHELEGTPSPGQFEADVRALSGRLDAVMARIAGVVERGDEP